MWAMDGAHTTNPTRGRKAATPTPGVAVLRLGGFLSDHWVKNKLDFSGRVGREVVELWQQYVFLPKLILLRPMRP